MEQCFKDCQAHDPLSTVYSDHKIVVTKLRLSLLANGKTTTAKRTSFDWHCFSTSHSVRESYTVKVKNRFEALYQLEEKHSVNDLYTTMIKAQMDAAEKCIPKKKRVKKRVPWEKELVKDKRNELKKAYLKNKRLPNSDNANYLKQRKRNFKLHMTANKWNIWPRNALRLKTLQCSIRQKTTWDTINEITGRTPSATGGLIKAKLLNS